VEYDPKMSLTDIFFFDGASYVQKAGQVLMAKFPRTSCFHGGEHVVSRPLFFTDIAVIFYCPFLIIIMTLTYLLCPQILILKTCRLYNVFGLGANHAIAMFGDDDINFDMQLERFDVDMGALKEPAVERIFRAWVEEWEEEARMKNDCVEDARLLTKYKGLVFNDPDSGSRYIFCLGSKHGVS
jgi:hypothetical protein